MDENRRMFEINDDEKYYVADPTAEDIRGADWNYHKMYTKALTENIATSGEMMGILLKRGIVGPEFEQRKRELTDILSRKIVELGASEDMEIKEQLAYEVSAAREELFQWNQRLNVPLSNTCEQIADDARLEYLTASIIQKENGAKVWDSYDAFLMEKNQNLALRSRYEVMLYLQGMTSDFLEKTPEAVAIKEVQAQLIAKAAEVELAQSAEESIEVDEAKPTKRSKKKEDTVE